MKRKIQLCLLAFLAIAGIGWAITTETTTTLTVDATKTTDADNHIYATLQEAITAANAVTTGTDVMIMVQAGEYTGTPVSALEQQTASFGKLTKDNTTLSVASGAKVTLKGTLQIEAESVTINGFTFVNKCGNDPRTKNSLDITADKATVINNEFKVAEDKVTGICNGIVLKSKTTSTDYTIADNEFNLFAQSVYDDNYRLTWQSTGIIWCDVQNTSETKKVDNEIATGNTFNGCFLDYVRYNETDNYYYYSSVSNPELTGLDDIISSLGINSHVLLKGNYTVKSTIEMKNNITFEGRDKATLSFANTDGLKIASNDVILSNLNVVVEGGIPVVIGSEKTGIKIVGGSYSCNKEANEGKQGESAIRFEGQNGAINVSGTTLTGGIFVDDCNGSLAGITGNTINFTYDGDTPLVGINVVCKAGNKNNVGVTAAQLAAANQITMPTKGIQNKVLFQDENWAVYDGVAASSTISVADAEGLKSAIKLATAGQTIELTGTEYGTAGSTQVLGEVKVPNLTIKAAGNVKPKVYGTIKLMAEGCTVDGLDFYVQGAHPTRNALYVLAKTVTIQNNTFNVGTETSKLNNGVCIYPYGESAVKYIINKNTFNGFKNEQSGYQSAGLIIAEGLPVANYFTGNYTEEKTVAVNIENEIDIWKNNTFTNCYCDYAHSTWITDGSTEERRFCVLSSGDPDALSTAAHYSLDQAPVYLAGEYTLTKPLVISKAITLQSADTTAVKRATIKGHLVVETEKAAVKDLNFECNSIGYKYNEKNAISVFANAVTLTGNAFTQAANIGEAFVTNGIVLYPQTSNEQSGEGVAVSYNVTGNTFTGITKTETGGATSTPIIIRENFSDNSQLDGKPATATISGFASDNEIATKNTFTNCAGGEYYVRLNASNYIYSSVYGDAATVAAVKATAENGTVKTAISSVYLLKGLVSYNSALNDKLSIQCSDVLIVNDEATAKALAKQGKAVKLLKYTSDGSGDKYTYAEIDTSDPHIVSLPDSVVFGVDPIKLITNVTGATISIESGTNGTEGQEFVSLDADGKLLTILKPGTVTLKITVTEGTANNAEKTYEQTLKILKRTISLTGGLKAYGDVYDGEDSVKVNVIANEIKFSGVKEGSKLTITQSGTIEGKMADANVGTNKAVTFEDNAITLVDSSAWYDLAPVTFVTTNISKKELTVTAKEKESNTLTRLYGAENPEFDVTYSGFVTVNEVAETAETAVEGTPKFNCAATKTSPAGEYPVTPYGLTAKNYELKYVACTLKVNPTTPTVETVSAVVNKDKSITMIGKIVDNGGATGLSKGDTTVVFLVKKGTESAVSNTAILKGNEFSFTTASFADAADTYTIQAKATIGKNGSTKENTGKEIAVVINTKTPQTVSFASTLSKLTYGSSATLVGTSDEVGATGDYTYSIVEGDNTVLSINEKGELTTKGIGKATVKVSRATDTDYAAADAYMTIEVTPKPVSVVLSNQDELTKEYDGTTALATRPIYALSDGAKVGNDNVSVAAVSGARFAGVNAGPQTILLPEIKLEGAAAANYTLLQPSAPTGSIKAKALTVKVNDAVRSYNDLYTDYTFTWSGFVNGENANIPGIYSGTLKVTEPTSFTDNVTEKTGTLSLDISTVKLANYTLKAADQQGTLTIKRGTPVAIVYGRANDISTLLVDDAGYGKENLTFDTPVANQFTQIKKGETVIGQTLNKIADATTNQALVLHTYSTKAMSNWDNTTAIEDYSYGAEIEITTETGYTYESSGKLTIINIEDSKLTCKANGIGGAVIIATSADDVKFMYFDIQAQTVKAVPVGEYSKVYDGTTLASGLQVELKDNADNAITDDIALNTTGINFNFETKDAGKGNINPSQALVLTGSQRNNYKLETALTGEITKATLTISGPISKYYDGKTTTVVSDYAATGRIEGETVPVTVTFANANVNATVTINSWTLVNDADKKNYTLAGSGLTGSILKSTMLADLKQAPNRSELIKRARFTLIETGETGIQLADYNPDVQLIDGEFHVSGGDTDNYTVTYASTKADNANDPTPPVGPSTVSVESVSLDATTKTLPRQESFTLKATLNPSDATNQNVTWKSSDETILKVEKGSDGLSCKVTALKVGKATVTVTTEDGGKTATCEVTVDFATGLEEAIANTVVYGKNGYIHIQPVAPMQAWVVNIAGIVVYHATISSVTQIPVSSGIYLVKLGIGSEAVVTKVNVR